MNCTDFSFRLCVYIHSIIAGVIVMLSLNGVYAHDLNELPVHRPCDINIIEYDLEMFYLRRSELVKVLLHFFLFFFLQVSNLRQ